MTEGLWIGEIVFIGIIMSGVMLYPLRLGWKLSIALGLLMTLCLLGAYAEIGNWFRWQTYEKERLKVNRAKALLSQYKTPEAVIKQLKAKLEQQPQSAKGWYLLGRLYASQGQWVEAQQAFQKAHELAPAQADYWANYLIALTKSSPQLMSEKVRLQFQALLRQHPNQPEALLFLATDAQARHQEAQAMIYWQRLLKLVPPESEDARAIRKLLRE